MEQVFKISMEGKQMMINALFLIPTAIAAYLLCYFIMTYKVDQD
jgi:hypothetical protein